ncbi:hypothetical protein PYCC9005_001534 [Savitreella phatthalungensis]
MGPPLTDQYDEGSQPAKTPIDTEGITVKLTYKEDSIHKDIPLNRLFQYCPVTEEVTLLTDELRRMAGLCSDCQVFFTMRRAGSKEYEPLHMHHYAVCHDSQYRHVKSVRRIRVRINRVPSSAVTTMLASPIAPVRSANPAAPIKFAANAKRLQTAKTRVTQKPALKSKAEEQANRYLQAFLDAGNGPVLSRAQSYETQAKPSTQDSTIGLMTRAEFTTMLNDAIADALAKANSVPTVQQAKSNSSPIAPPAESIVQHNAICDGCESSIVGVRQKCLDCPDFDYCGSCFDSKAAKNHSSHRFVKVTTADAISSCRQSRTTVHKNIFCDGPGCAVKPDAEKEIRGSRYKCTVCPDLDLCENCEADPNKTHDGEHPMTVYKVPKSRGISLAINGNFGLTKPAVAQGSNALHCFNGNASRFKGISIPANRSQQQQPQQQKMSAQSKPDLDHASPAVKSEPAPLPIHHRGVACDSCDKLIVGDRYMCASCPDFDYCEPCYSSAEQTHDKTHVFIRHKTPLNSLFGRRDRIQAVSEDASELDCKTAYRCDGCQTIISPATSRFSCRRCEDFDMCGGCANEADAHDKTHPIAIFPPRIESPPPTATRQPVGPPQSTISAAAPKAELVEDLTIPDGSVVAAGSTFVKQWSVRNTGETSWPVGVFLAFAGGIHFQSGQGGAEATLETKVAPGTAVAPGETTVVSAMRRAPDTVCSNVISYWRLCTPDGLRFGPRLWIDVDVCEARALQSLSNYVNAAAVEKDTESSTPTARPDNVSTSKVDRSATLSTSHELILPSASTELLANASTVDGANHRGEADRRSSDGASDFTNESQRHYEVVDMNAIDHTDNAGGRNTNQATITNPFQGPPSEVSELEFDLDVESEYELVDSGSMEYA